MHFVVIHCQVGIRYAAVNKFTLYSNTAATGLKRLIKLPNIKETEKKHFQIDRTEILVGLQTWLVALQSTCHVDSNNPCHSEHGVTKNHNSSTAVLTMYF